MEPHNLEQDGEAYEIRFVRLEDAWIAQIRRLSDDAVRSVAFGDGVGYDAADPRGSLIAGCEAAIARFSAAPPTRH